MEISAKELRGRPSQIIEQASRGAEVVITIRGKKMARMVPYKEQKRVLERIDEDDLLFGLWKDREDMESVDETVRALRKRRTF